MISAAWKRQLRPICSGLSNRSLSEARATMTRLIEKW
nr:MAG TPA_asm: hypothetical protein [Caudoviricetes sp.]